MMGKLHLSIGGFLSALIIGVALGLLSTTFSIADTVSFWLRPIVQMSGEVVERTSDDAILLHITGKKLRGVECRYLGLQAFGERLVGPLVDLYIERTDRKSEGTTKPNGMFDIGYWKVWPTTGITAVRVYVTHDCAGTLWATEITKVEL